MLLRALIDGTERTLLPTDFEELVREGRVDAETPVAVGDAPPVPAYTLGIYREVVGTPAARFRAAWDRPGIPWATALLAGLCIRAYLWAGDWMYERMLRASDAIVLRGEVWRVLTYAFLHGSAGHILSNLSFLVFISLSLERIVGARAILALWVASTAGGGLLATWFLPGASSVGASGGDYGFLAAAAVVGWRWIDLIPRPARARFGGAMAFFTLYSFYGGTQREGVDSWCHLGGLLAGGVFGALLRPVTATYRENDRVSAALVGGVGLALVVVFALGYRLLPLEPAKVDGAVGVRPSWWGPGWTQAGGTGWVEPSADGRGGVGGVGAAFGISTERRGRDWLLADATGDVLTAYRDADPALVVERETVALDGIEGERLALSWVTPVTSPHPGTPMHSVVDVFLRGHYRTIVSWDAPPGTPAGLRARLLEPLHLVDPSAVADAGGGESLRARTLQAHALFEVGRRSAALALFAPGLKAADPKEVVAALTTCAPEFDVACEPAIVAGVALASGPTPTVEVVRALVQAQIAAGRPEDARAAVETALVSAPSDPGLARLMEGLGVSTDRPE